MADFLQVTDTEGATHLVNVEEIAHITPFNGGSQVLMTSGSALAHADPPATFAATAAAQVIAAGGTFNRSTY